MFNQNTTADTKIAVLEERLSSYELMLNKIDEAIQMMSKTSQNISKMLAVHEEKIEQCARTDEMVTRTINELREENKSQHKEVEDKMGKLESKIDDIGKFRWILIGAAIFMSFIFSNSSTVIDVLTPALEPARIQRGN
jgi:chromosome segregation ATPase